MWCALGTKNGLEDIVCWENETRVGILSQSDLNHLPGTPTNIWKMEAGPSSLCIGYLVAERRRFDCLLMTNEATNIQFSKPDDDWFSGAWDPRDFAAANYYTTTTHQLKLSCYLDVNGDDQCAGSEAHRYNFTLSDMDKFAYSPDNNDYMMCQYSDVLFECVTGEQNGYDYGAYWTDFFSAIQPGTIASSNSLGACGISKDYPQKVACTESARNPSLQSVPEYLAY